MKSYGYLQLLGLMAALLIIAWIAIDIMGNFIVVDVIIGIAFAYGCYWMNKWVFRAPSWTLPEVPVPEFIDKAGGPKKLMLSMRGIKMDADIASETVLVTIANATWNEEIDPTKTPKWRSGYFREKLPLRGPKITDKGDFEDNAIVTKTPRIRADNTSDFEYNRTVIGSGESGHHRVTFTCQYLRPHVVYAESDDESQTRIVTTKHGSSIVVKVNKPILWRECDDFKYSLKKVNHQIDDKDALWMKQERDKESSRKSR